MATDSDPSGLSHPGWVRTRNEDRIHVDAKRGIHLVADGVGSSDDGARAAELAVETVVAFFQDADATWPVGIDEAKPMCLRRLEAAVTRANATVFDEGLATQKDLTTTLLAALVGEHNVAIAHVGDSRAFLWRSSSAGSSRRKLLALTTDHNVLEQARAMARGSHPLDVPPMEGPLLTRAVGAEEDIQVDLALVPTHKGDRLLLCTDGLTKVVGADEIEAILESAKGTKEAVRALVRAALEAGGPDNVSVVVVGL